MRVRFLTEEAIKRFNDYLQGEEKSKATIEKYIRDVQAFVIFLSDAEVTKESVIAYKNKLLSDDYAARSVNSMIASINSLLSFLG